MIATRIAGLMCSLSLLLVIASSAMAQFRDREGGRDDRGREDRGREDRGREDRGREGGRDFDPRDIIRQADDNNDGMIDPSEVGQRSGYYIRRAAERAGLDSSKPIPVDKVLPALEAMRAESSGSNNSTSSSGSSSRPMTPAPNGFGAPAASAAPGAAGFNVPLTASSGGGLEKRFSQQVIQYVDDMIRERDANKNGVLEKNEWTGRWATPAEESDTNKDNVLDKEELCVRISKRFGGTGTPAATVAVTPGGPPGGGFGPFGGGPPGGPGGPFGGGPPGGGGGDDRDRYRRYAEGMIRQYDRNRDGKLDKEESSQMRSEHQSADVNSDGIITQDELQTRLQNYAGGGSSSGGSSSGEGGRRWGRGSDSGDNKTAAAPARTSYRFTTPAERLPKGLPDWFLRGDADSDGQVSMAEYTTTWTEQLAAEFLKYDANGDGIITPAECQAVAGPPRR